MFRNSMVDPSSPPLSEALPGQEGRGRARKSQQEKKRRKKHFNKGKGKLKKAKTSGKAPDLNPADAQGT